MITTALGAEYCTFENRLQVATSLDIFIPEEKKVKVEYEVFDISPMKRGAFKLELAKLNCIYLHKDGLNHDIYQNTSNQQTTSLGLGGHGDSIEQSVGQLKTYLNQLGITPSEWNKRK